MSSRIKIILAVSIILNFLLIGLILGSFSTRYMYRWERKDNLTAMVENLPKEKQKLLIAKFEKLHKQKRENWKKIRKRKSELIDVIKAPVFNEDLYDKKVNELHGQYREMAVRQAKSIKELAISLNQEERKALSKFLKKKHRKGIHNRYKIDH